MAQVFSFIRTGPNANAELSFRKTALDILAQELANEAGKQCCIRGRLNVRPQRPTSNTDGDVPSNIGLLPRGHRGKGQTLLIRHAWRTGASQYRLLTLLALQIGVVEPA